MFHLANKTLAEVGPHDVEPFLPRALGGRIDGDEFPLRQPDGDRRPQHLARIAAHVRVVPAVLEHDVVMAPDRVLSRNTDIQVVVCGRPGGRIKRAGGLEHSAPIQDDPRRPDVVRA